MSGTDTLPGPLDPAVFPVLRERPALDLVNTRYRHRETTLDFLATPAHVETWAAAALPPGWSAIRSDEAGELRELRDAARAVLHAVVEETPSPARDLAVVNRVASNAVFRRSVVEGEAGLVMRESAVQDDQRTVLLLVLDFIDVVAGAPRRVAACARGRCSMFFMRTHHLRRYCTPSCAHLDRQQRYLQRTTPRHAPPRS